MDEKKGGREFFFQLKTSRSRCEQKPSRSAFSRLS